MHVSRHLNFPSAYFLCVLTAGVDQQVLEVSQRALRIFGEFESFATNWIESWKYFLPSRRKWAQHFDKKTRRKKTRLSAQRQKCARAVSQGERAKGEETVSERASERVGGWETETDAVLFFFLRFVEGARDESPFTARKNKIAFSFLHSWWNKKRSWEWWANSREKSQICSKYFFPPLNRH